MIFGRPGSGKSTFAVRLHRALGLPVYHLDRYFFVCDWQKRGSEEFLSLQQSIVLQDKWIIDGNALRTLDIRYQRAQVAIYFAFPRYLCLWRILKRRFTERDPHILDRATGCDERVRWPLLTYTWSFKKRITPILSYLQTTYPEVALHIVHSDEEVNTLFSQLVS